MCRPTTQFKKNITITFDVPCLSYSLSSQFPHTKLPWLLYLGFPIHHLCLTTEYIVNFAGFLILYKWSHTIYIFFQCMLSSFNTLLQILIYIFSAFTVSSLFGISLSEHITIYLLILLLVEISVASGVLLSYNFTLTALIYILYMYEVWLGGNTSFQLLEITLSYFSKWLHHLSSQPQFITIPLVLHPHQHLNC